MASSLTSSSSSTTSTHSTPKPKLDLFHDSPRLVAKKCRTSTPSLRPPKPPTKSSSSTRRCRQSAFGLLESHHNHHLNNYSTNHNLQNNHHHNHHHNLSLQHHHQPGLRNQQQQFFPSRRLNNTNNSYFYVDNNHHDDHDMNGRPLTPTTYKKPALNRHDGSFSFGLTNTSISENQQHDENDMEVCRLNKQFDIISRLGSGNFGDVYKVKSKIEQDKYYAIKRTLMPFTSESDRKRKFQEVENHQMLPPHENCVKYYDSWEEDGYLYIQTELCRSNLNEIIEANPDRTLPEFKVWKYLINLLSAVKHLHDHNLLHLDIKPENIFISFDDEAKLGDFGLMCNYSDLNSSISIEGHSFRPDPDDSGILNKSFNSSTMVTTIDTSSLDSIEEGDSKYLASEAMQGKFTKAADIYSLGITMFEAASGMELPQRGETYHKLRQNQIDELYFNGLSDDLVKIIKLMMEADYSVRPLVDELLQLDVVRARRSNINHT